MKSVKILVKVVLWALALVVAALLALPLWFGPVVRLVANASVPGIVKTDFHLGHLSLNPYTARFELGDVQLGNPKGYSEKYAVTLGDIVFDAHTASLVTDVIHVEEIKIKDIFVSYVSGGPEKVNNFLQLQYDAAGGKEKYEASQVRKEQQGVDRVEQDDGSKPQKQKSSKKVVIDRLEVSGISMKLGVVPIRIPSLVMTDIGKSSNGATMEEVWQKILESVMKAAGAVGEQFKALGGAMSQASDSAIRSVSETTAKTSAAVSDVAGKTTSAVGDAAKKTSAAVGDTANKAVEGVGNALKKLW